jgi:hypothetical protein
VAPSPCVQLLPSQVYIWRQGVPTIVVANKIDVDYKVTQKSFKFAETRQLVSVLHVFIGMVPVEHGIPRSYC